MLPKSVAYVQKQKSNANLRCFSIAAAFELTIVQTNNLRRGNDIVQTTSRATKDEQNANKAYHTTD